MGLNPRKYKRPIPASYFKKNPRIAWIIFPPGKRGNLRISSFSAVHPDFVMLRGALKSKIMNRHLTHLFLIGSQLYMSV